MTVAIDWGNTNTVVAFGDGRREHTLRLSGKELIPSCMLYDDAGQLLSIGWKAKNSLRLGQQNVVAGIKRLIGVKYDETARRWAEAVYGLTLQSDNGAVQIKIGETYKSPECLAREYFERLRQLLQEEIRRSSSAIRRIFGQTNIGQCLATCPAHYHDTQRMALRECLGKAGFDVPEDGLLPEPAAVCSLAANSNTKNALIIDWGGGTLDFAVVTSANKCEYLSAIQKGCGGIDMDIAIIQGLFSNARIPPDLTRIDLAVLREYVEDIKERLLSSETEASVQETIILPDRNEAIIIECTRQEVLEWIEPVVVRATNGIGQVLAEVSEKWPLKGCILIGGPVTSLHILQEVREVVPNGIPVQVFENPTTAVARGTLRSRKAGMPEPPLGHDYGVAVDLISHTMGVLLLRSRQKPPVGSVDRQMKLRGHVGRPVEVSVWARKVNPADESFHYEGSSSFTFIPRFDQDGSANINVSLQTDAAGIVTARVIDAATNQQMALKQVGAQVSERMSGPPCRSVLEAAGLLLLACWRDFIVTYPPLDSKATDARTQDRTEIEKFIRDWLKTDRGPSPSERLKKLARDSIRYAQQIENPPQVVVNTLQEVSHTCSPRAEIKTPATVAAAICSLDNLFVELIRCYGERRIIPLLKDHPACKADEDLNRKVTHLESVFHNFSTDKYERLAAFWGEIAIGIWAEDLPADSVLERFGFVKGVLNLHAALRLAASELGHRCQEGTR